MARFGGIGDNIVASSVLSQFKKQGYMVEVITQKPFHVVFENNPYIDKLSVKDDGDIPHGGNVLQWQDWFNKRAKEYDRFYHLSHSMEYLLALSPEQCAFWWSASFRRKLCDHSYLAVVHDICEVPHEYSPNFYPTDIEIYQALETKSKIGDRCIGWHIAGSRIDKIHPYSAMIIARLIKEVGPVVMFGSPTDKEKSSAQAIHDHVRRQNGSADGLHLAMSPAQDNQTWPIRRSLSMFQQCDLLIGPDSGLMWSVAIHEMPKIVMLGHASVKNIVTGWINTVALHADSARVPCAPCHKLHNDPSTCTPNAEGTAAACISDIDAETIISTAERLWKAKEQHDGHNTASTRDGECRRVHERRSPRGQHPRDGRKRRTNGPYSPRDVGFDSIPITST